VAEEKEYTGSKVFSKSWYLKSNINRNKFWKNLLYKKGKKLSQKHVIPKFSIIPTLSHKEKLFQNTPIWNVIIPSGSPD
jgi:hypothetical protein